MWHFVTHIIVDSASHQVHVLFILNAVLGLLPVMRNPLFAVLLLLFEVFNFKQLFAACLAIFNLKLPSVCVFMDCIYVSQFFVYFTDLFNFFFSSFSLSINFDSLLIIEVCRFRGVDIFWGSSILIEANFINDTLLAVLVSVNLWGEELELIWVVPQVWEHLLVILRRGHCILEVVQRHLGFNLAEELVLLSQLEFVSCRLWQCNIWHGLLVSMTLLAAWSR